MTHGNDDRSQKARAQPLDEKHPGLEVLSAEPENAQTDSRANLASYLTPREQHYIRNHYRTPAIDAAEWRVSLTGLVEEQADLSIDELEHDFPDRIGYPYDGVLGKRPGVLRTGRRG